VTDDVCGTSVPDVCVVLDVVLAATLVDVVLADVVDVVEDELEVGLLEQAASARAQAARMVMILRFTRSHDLGSGVYTGRGEVIPWPITRWACGIT